PNLNEVAASEHAAIRVLLPSSGKVVQSTPGAPELDSTTGTIVGLDGGVNVDGYRVEAHTQALSIGGFIVIQYARPLSDVQPTIAGVELLLALGVLFGAGFALLVGRTIARRAMAPIAQLTSTAEEIARTRDPSRSVPQPESEDEVAELARTLQGMLHELAGAHAETEAALTRQRQFLADASHELRTPLTSVLANLELLADSLRGDEREAAHSALRSSQRMRRLVADLLLLARTDVGRVVRREPVDLAQIVVEAAAELGPVSATHEIALDVHPTIVDASRDELHRVAINLIENALRHTPPGTEIWVSTQSTDAHAQLIVEDSGPGVPEHLADSLFERFVRGAGDHGGSFGLGLAIVRAVTRSHGGSVSVGQSSRPGMRAGARFVVTLPLARSDVAPLSDGMAVESALTES
ncbi:MAG: sensor histidine kinase, partial [Solirubrobacteraceae bacterium]